MFDEVVANKLNMFAVIIKRRLCMKNCRYLVFYVGLLFNLCCSLAYACTTVAVTLTTPSGELLSTGDRVQDLFKKMGKVPAKRGKQLEDLACRPCRSTLYRYQFDNARTEIGVCHGQIVMINTDYQ